VGFQEEGPRRNAGVSIVIFCSPLLQGYLKRRAYISAQGPLAHTVKDFWRMVWEQHVSVIAVVTRFVENGKEKAYRYWPSARTTEEYGTMHVTFEAERDTAAYTVRRFLVRNVARWVEQAWRLW
jgi:protein tyrosine phosphatase